MLKTAIFLDADGVINKAIIKNGKPAAPISLAELEIPNEVKPALDALKEKGFLLICVTNKPDIERGIMTQTNLDSIVAKIRHDLPLDDIYICYHEGSSCYKPNPGMLLSAAKKWNIDLEDSYMIGDRWSDIAAGQNAGCKTIWINRKYANEKSPEIPPNYMAFSLMEAKDWIINQNK
ncbi:MAG: HAD-IIIA family hydrolase [Gammaproteobacteria bacterium]|nr:HAD-IIIA family hydrolase [Gammaproteobacteria bacterium]